MSRGRPAGTTQSNHKERVSITLSRPALDWARSKNINLSATLEETLAAMRYSDMRITAVIVDGDGVHEISANSAKRGC